MILNRSLRSLLKRLGLDENSPPDWDNWALLLVRLNDFCQDLEEDRSRLVRTAGLQGNEVQSLYQELMAERDKLNSAIGCLTIGFVVFDAEGSVLVMNAEAEQILGLTERECAQRELLEQLSLEGLFQVADLRRSLLAGKSLVAQAVLTSTDGNSIEAKTQLQPIIRRGKLHGSVLTMELPQAALAEISPRPKAAPQSLPSPFAPAQQPPTPVRIKPAPVLRGVEPELARLIQQMEALIDREDSSRIDSPMRASLDQARAALSVLRGEPIPSPTQEDVLQAIPESGEVVETPPPRKALTSAGTSRPMSPPIPKKPTVQHPPAAAPPPVSATAGRPQVTLAQPPLRILLVEDEPVSLLITQSHLQELGQEVALAGDGNEALRMHQRQPFDVIISSQLMPGISGLELCKRVRAHGAEPHPYFILLTAADKQTEYNHATEAGVDAFLTKPLDADELTLSIRVVQGLHARARRSQALPDN